MNKRNQVRLWAAAFVGSAACAFGVLTIISKDWIEAVFGVDPDHHSGSLEVGLAAALFCISVLMASVARRELARPRVAARAPEEDPA